MSFRKYIAKLYENVLNLFTHSATPKSHYLPEDGKRPDNAQFAKALSILNMACYHDLAYITGKHISERQLDKILQKAARRVRLEEEYENLKPYIMYVGIGGQFFEFNSSDRSYIIR